MAMVKLFTVMREFGFCTKLINICYRLDKQQDRFRDISHHLEQGVVYHEFLLTWAQKK